MTATTLPPTRIATLDIVRGVAVMGILAMNIVAFAMPREAYVNPLAYGMEGTKDAVSWGLSFILIDGKMRGLFSFLFGASTLLVIEKAGANGQSPLLIHYSRMAWLLVFGAIHFYLIWYGDILMGYALVGLVLWHWREKEPRELILWGGLFLFIQFALLAALGGLAWWATGAAAGPNPSPDAVQTLRELQVGLTVPTPAGLEEQFRLFLGPWAGVARDQLGPHLLDPLIMLGFFGWETLGYMLFGMAALKSGFLSGAWEDARYRRVAAVGLGIGIAAYALLAWLAWADSFSVFAIFGLMFAATVPLRPAMIVATAALVILLTRRGGALVERVAAAGRAAFSNYLGTSILMTFVFYGWGLGQFGAFSRAELWLVVVAAWALMLLWSKPWLERFRYGPLEWLWRSLSRWSLQPMRKAAGEASA